MKENCYTVKFKVKKNDTVEILAGKDKGKRGTIARILPKKNAVVVTGLNIVKKTMKRKSQQDQGGITDVEAPLDISNVGIICKKCGRPVRVGYKIDADKKVRVCRKCGDIL